MTKLTAKHPSLRSGTRFLAAGVFLAAIGGAVWAPAPGTAATGCNPPCPKGQVCAYKSATGSGHDVVCKTPIKVPECKDNNPLCGLDRKRKGTFKAR